MKFFSSVCDAKAIATPELASTVSSPAETFRAPQSHADDDDEAKRARSEMLRVRRAV